jgi:hypothetical protein
MLPDQPAPSAMPPPTESASTLKLSNAERQQLAEKVLALLKRELRLERERAGPRP